MKNGSGGAAGAGLFVAVGLIASSFVLGTFVLKYKNMDRYVTVKGLVERDVQADLAVWPLRFSNAGNDLPLLQQQVEQQQAAVKAFLQANGIKPEHIINSGLSVFNREAVEYGNNNVGQPKYNIKSTIIARSNDVTAIQNASQKTSALVSQGIALEQNDCILGPSYSFTKLNEIKPDMLAEATKNARQVAEQFAVSSGSKVGEIRQANQGVFSVVDRDRAAEGADDGACGKTSDINKRVRVVTTLDYYLEN
jgi:hypothetical protein